MRLRKKAKVAEILTNNRCVFYKQPFTKMWHFETELRDIEEIDLVRKFCVEMEKLREKRRKKR